MPDYQERIILPAGRLMAWTFNSDDPSRTGFNWLDAQGRAHACLFDADNVKTAAIPSYIPSPFNHAILYKGEYVVISQSNGPPNPQAGIVVRDHTITYDPFSLTITDTEWFGDIDSRPVTTVITKGGDLLLFWYQQRPKPTPTTPPTYPCEYGVAIKSGDVWQTLFPIVMPGKGGNGTSCSIACVEHPTNGEVWMFSKRDGYKAIEFTRLRKNGSTWVVVGTDANYITTQSVVPPYPGYAGLNGPDGEIPKLVAQVQGEDVLLCYQSHDRKVFKAAQPPDYQQITGSKMVVCRIRPDGSKVFVKCPDTYWERVSFFGFYADSEKWCLCGDTVDATKIGPGLFREYSVAINTWKAAEVVGSLKAHIRCGETKWLVQVNDQAIREWSFVAPSADSPWKPGDTVAVNGEIVRVNPDKTYTVELSNGSQETFVEQQLI